jgi:hypothetical protein
MQRTTRKQSKGRHLRLTRRATALSQVGGANWYVISDTDRKAMWKTVLGDNTPLSFITSEWRTGPDAMKRYGMMLAQQDDLLQAARQCMMTSAGIDETTPAKNIVAATSRVNTAYLDDVLSFISFKDEVLSSTDTKTEYLRKNILDCLLFPKSVENLLIYSIASVIVNLKRNPTLLTDAATTQELKSILVRQCNAFYRELVYEQTASASQDTFYMRQTETNASKDRNTFWPPFLEECIAPISVSRVDSIGFYRIAAAIYHNIDAEDIVIAVFATLKGPQQMTIPSFTAAPDASLWDKLITDNITYKAFVMDGYKPRHIEFLFHLSHTVKKILSSA